MPSPKIHQIAAKLETNEAVDAWGGGAPSASDLVRVTEVTLSGSLEQEEAVTSGATLSTDFSSPGIETRSIQFKTQLVGNVTGADADAKRNALPAWDLFAKAAGWRRSSLLRITGTFTGPFFIGERIAAAAWAGSPAAWGIAMSEGGSELYVAVVEGDISAGSTFYGEESGSQITTATVDATGGVCYSPVSSVLLSVDLTAGGWSASSPAAGDVVRVLRSGQQIGSCRVVTVADPLIVQLYYGSFVAGDVLETAAGSQATVDTAASVFTQGGSLSIWSNRDGLARRLIGSRGDVTISGEPGKIPSMAWQFDGGASAEVDAALLSTTNLSNLAGPRWVSGRVHMGYLRGASYFNTGIPLKRFEVRPGFTREARTSPLSATGVDGYDLSGRNAQISFDVEQVGVVAFDWFGARRAATATRIGFGFGSDVGNRFGIAVPRGQIMEIADAESGARATHSVTINARRIREAGDDEILIAKF